MTKTYTRPPRVRFPAALGWLGLFLALCIALVLTVGAAPADGPPPSSATGQAGTTATATAPDSATPGGPPETWTFPSHVGEVRFPHAMHVEELELECTECHHDVQAPELHSPHPQYFEEGRIECQTCHHMGPAPSTSKQCTSCHHRSSNIRERIPSAKVALHQTCGNCHEIGTGAEASQSCTTCHSGPEKPW